jgi:hypothetical protein
MSATCAGEGLIALSIAQSRRSSFVLVDSISRGAFSESRLISGSSLRRGEPDAEQPHHREHDERARRSIEQREEQRVMSNDDRV